MKFFIPFAVNDAQTHRILKRINDTLRTSGYQINQPPFYQVSYLFQGALVSDTVGQVSAQHNEIVLAILSFNDDYLICTYSRGVTWGKPLIAYQRDVTAVVAFESG